MNFGGGAASSRRTFPDLRASLDGLFGPRVTVEHASKIAERLGPTAILALRVVLAAVAVALPRAARNVARDLIPAAADFDS